MPYRIVCMLGGRSYNPGDPRPEGYHAWQEWAGVQYRAGLRQERCGRCALLRFPAEMGGERIESTLFDARGNARKVSSPVCLECEKP